MMVLPRLMIGGQQVPVSTFTVTGGTYGSTGSLVAQSSMPALDAAGVDLVSLSIANPGSLPVDLYVVGGASTSHVFSGEYLTGEYDYNADSVVVHARDWSGPLVDQKRALTQLVKGITETPAPEESNSGVSTQNQKLSAIVTQIANQFSLTPDLRLNSNISNADADYGAIFGDSTDTVMTATPQSLWGILTRLARQSGNVVYVTPEKHLVFGEAGAGLDTLNFTWRLTGNALAALGQATSMPLMRLHVTHNPRRNLTFRVLVKSYDPTVQQLTSGQAFVIGSDYSPDGQSTVHAGAWGGAQASQISAALGNNKKKAIPEYTYHVDGLTASQAQSRAEAIAADIAKRELIVKGNMDFLPSMEPGQQATLRGLVNREFAAHTYYVTHFAHQFSIGARAGGPSGQLHTDFTLLDRQPEGQAKAVSKPAPVG